MLHLHNECFGNAAMQQMHGLTAYYLAFCAISGRGSGAGAAPKGGGALAKVGLAGNVWHPVSSIARNARQPDFPGLRSVRPVGATASWRGKPWDAACCRLVSGESNRARMGIPRKLAHLNLEQ